jgi:hypothetical protein
MAGVGKTFFIGTAPTTAPKDYVNSTVGVTATEDNTTVTVSGYNPSIIFADGSVMATRTFKINKGKSYILDVNSDMGGTPNRRGLVGAKLVADKPVSVTNGNFNGLYTAQNSTNVDILMDQAVPTERLGKTLSW